MWQAGSSVSQSTDQEHPSKCNLLRPRPVHPPDIRQRERHHSYIRQNIGDRTSDDKFVVVDVASRMLGMIPETGDRITLEDGRKNLNR